MSTTAPNNSDLIARAKQLRDSCSSNPAIQYRHVCIGDLITALELAQAENERLKALSVTSIMLDVTPGSDGMGHEVYAKSVEDVVQKLSEMGGRLEDYELGITPLPFADLVQWAVKTYSPLGRAASDLLAAVDDRHDNSAAPLKYSVPYGAVNDLREAVNAVRAALPTTSPDPLGIYVPGTYGFVLTPFVQMMEAELKANSNKGDRPGWLAMTRAQAMLEIYWHAAKLQRAVGDDDLPLVREHAADVANMAMMLLDVCGGLLPEGS